MQPKLARCKLPFSANAANDRDRKGRAQKSGVLSPLTPCLSSQPHVAQLKEGDLNKYSVIQKTWITATEGKRYEANVYNLDMIIAVGYRVNSYKATRFR